METLIELGCVVAEHLQNEKMCLTIYGHIGTSYMGPLVFGFFYSQCHGQIGKKPIAHFSIGLMLLFQFMTDKLRFFGPYGGTGGTNYVSSHPKCAMSHISGSGARLLDNIIIHYVCP